MAEDTTNQITQPEPVVATTPVVNHSQERITELSDKVKSIAEERDTVKAKAEEAERRAAFAEGFVDVVTANPAAKDHKDEIKEKVLKGYSMQDATFAVLGAAGKLGNTQSAPVTHVAGGSASTAMPQGGSKDPKDMTQAERRELLSKEIGWE